VDGAPATLARPGTAARASQPRQAPERVAPENDAAIAKNGSGPRSGSLGHAAAELAQPRRGATVGFGPFPSGVDRCAPIAAGSRSIAAFKPSQTAGCQFCARLAGTTCLAPTRTEAAHGREGCLDRRDRGRHRYDSPQRNLPAALAGGGRDRASVPPVASEHFSGVARREMKTTGLRGVGRRSAP
jgi:hypothetical protein